MNRFPAASSKPHPYDKSLVTYQGHSIHRTLIRCYFSPPTSSGSRYVYSGSADGRCRIYNIDATLAGNIDVHKATTAVRQGAPGSRESYQYRELTCVRDVSWHPSAPVLAATSFQGGRMGKGTVSIHTWRGSPSDGDMELDSMCMSTVYDPQMRKS